MDGMDGMDYGMEGEMQDMEAYDENGNYIGPDGSGMMGEQEYDDEQE